jgi:uncharacterized RDD family membrane protein YckC
VAASVSSVPEASDPAWPGRRLGLPRSGARSVARPGRRILALALDWASASLLSAWWFDYEGFATLGLFVVLQIVFVVTLAGSIGHLATGIRVVPVQGGRLGLWRPVVRTLLIAVVVPALIWDADQRGFHDKVAGTLLVRV